MTQERKMNNLTVAEVKEAVPKSLQVAITQQFVDKLNNVSNDPVYAEHIRNNFITYSYVLKEGKYKTESYLNAIVYVSYKLAGLSNRDAYIKTFPQRYAAVKAGLTTSTDLDAYVSAFHHGKLVTAILEQVLVPSWILNQDAYQKAINKQVELMNTAKSEKIQCMAADSILTHLAKPQEKQGNVINIDARDSGGIGELRDALVSLAQTQRDMIKGGMSPKKIAEQDIIDVKSEDDN